MSVGIYLLFVCIDYVVRGGSRIIYFTTVVYERIGGVLCMMLIVIILATSLAMTVTGAKYIGHYYIGRMALFCMITGLCIFILMIVLITLELKGAL